jgi:tryptophan synthase alpha chain
VQLIGPLTRPERLKHIDAAATSFVYLVAHQGVTGVRDGSFDDVEALVSKTAWQLSSPLCVGFGLSQPEQIRKVFAAGARLAVVGSYLANVIGEAGRGDRVLAAFTDALEPLIEAAR